LAGEGGREGEEGEGVVTSGEEDGTIQVTFAARTLSVF